MTEKKASKYVKGGKPGNPRGRPPGSKNKKTLLQEVIRENSVELMMQSLPKIVEAVVAEARKGNMQAAKMILDRAIPVTKAVEISSKDKAFAGINIVIGSLEDKKIEVITNEKVIEGTVEEDND